jgi:hypothetical protein
MLTIYHFHVIKFLYIELLQKTQCVELDLHHIECLWLQVSAPLDSGNSSNSSIESLCQCVLSRYENTLLPPFSATCGP